MQCGRVGSRLLFYQSVHLSNQMDAFFIYVPYGPPANLSAKGLVFPRMAKVISRMVWYFRAWRKSFPEWFGVSAHGESHFLNSLMFPRLAKVISRKVWRFRAWRKSFPEWFGISAHGESRFPNGLAFPHMAKVVSQMVWRFRAWRMSFPERFGACGAPANHFLKVLTLAGLPQITF